MTEFYYDRRKLCVWAVFSLAVLWFGLHFFATTLIETFFVDLVKIVCTLAAFSAWYVYLKPQRLAKITPQGIIIDKNELLKWKDVDFAEKLKSGHFGRSFIKFKLKDDAKYNLRPMQKFSRASCYGAFSIPLYAMKKADAIEIEKEIEKYCTFSTSVLEKKAETKAEKKTGKKTEKKTVKSPAKNKRGKK